MKSFKTELIPALDLIDNQIVRLYQGDYTKAKAYKLDIKEQMKFYEAKGVKRLHLVDLSGAKDSQNRQLGLIKTIANNSKLLLQVGGGLRTSKDIKELLELGIDKVVIGSLAIKNPSLCLEFLQEFGPDTIILSLDVLFSQSSYVVAVNAWQDLSDKKLVDVLNFYTQKGLKHVLCTDISRDGTMLGSNIKLYKLLAKAFPNLHIQASGGVNSLNDLKELKNICSSVIIGKALLEGSFSIEEALKALNEI